METLPKVSVMLDETEMRSIAMAIDVTLREHGIKCIKQLAPILETLDEAIQEAQKLAEEVDNGENDSDY